MLFHGRLQVSSYVLFAGRRRERAVEVPKYFSARSTITRVRRGFVAKTCMYCGQLLAKEDAWTAMERLSGSVQPSAPTPAEEASTMVLPNWREELARLRQEQEQARAIAPAPPEKKVAPEPLEKKIAPAPPEKKVAPEPL